MAERPTKKKATAKTAGPNPNKRNKPDRDRRIRQADRLARVLRVLELIQSRGRWTTKAIADEIECSERTVYRDLDVLKFAGIPYYREGDQQFVRVRSDFRFPVMTLTDDEVLGLSLAAAITKAPGLDVTAGAVPATRKLAAVSKEKTQELIDDAMRLVSVLDLKLVDHSRHHEAIRTIQLALLQGKQVSGLYESPYEPTPVRLKLHPYRLCLIKNAWYVIGTMADEKVPKTFRVARFKTLRMQTELATVPEDFDLRTYFGNAWAVFRGDQSYDIELKFKPTAAKVVTETIWHHTQKASTHKDGSLTLSFQVDGLNEILNWILSWAGQVRVQKPDELKALFVQTLEDAIQIQAKADNSNQ
ncbi:MAG: WYL domain-containing protein [Planctomycetales bacterium]|nr:WYL domain-containing protein [Planctomycetales bacterium]